MVKVITPDHFESTEQTNRMIADFRSEWNIEKSTVHVINENTVHAGISYAAETVKADAIAMETHGRTGLSRFFYGSQTQSVVNHADVPVLSVKIQEYKSDFSPFSRMIK